MIRNILKSMLNAYYSLVSIYQAGYNKQSVTKYTITVCYITMLFQPIT